MLTRAFRLSLFVAVPLAFCFSACTFVTPAARYVPVESSATLPGGATEISGAFYTNASLNSASAGVGANVRVRHGVADDGRLDVVTNVEARGVPGEPSTTTVSGYGGVKFAPVPNFALTAGLGAGGGPTTAFFAPEIGVIAAYENDSLVPFVSARGVLGLPIWSQTMSLGGGDFSGPEREVGLRTSLGAHLTLGLRIPFGRDESGFSRYSVGFALGGMVEAALGDEEFSLGLAGSLGFSGVL